jgi:hypothetical protein
MRWAQGTAMKKLLVGALIAGSFFYWRQEPRKRAGDAALVRCPPPVQGLE